MRFLYTHTHTHYNLCCMMSKVKIAHLHALILERLVVYTLIFPLGFLFFLVLCKCESPPDSNLELLFCF